MNAQNTNYDSLQDALNVIKTVCINSTEGGGCCECPLGTARGDCMVSKTCPRLMRPRNPSTDVFRVLE